MVVSELRIYEFLVKELKIEDSVAKRYVRDIVNAEEKLENQVKTKIDKKFEDAKQYLATKEDIANLKTDMARTIYIVGLVQYLAMLASLIAVIKFLM